MPTDNKFMQQAIDLATTKMQEGQGGPFGAIIVCDGVIVAQGFNRVTSSLDPTAHAEIDAIRKACQQLKSFRLKGCEIFINCEPCPMCLAAIYWAGIQKITYAATRKDAAAIGFADDLIYEEIGKAPSDRSIPMIQLMREEAMTSFKAWQENEEKIRY
jgi:tRNA(Arg) A34 adenosine deaminase TadA